MSRDPEKAKQRQTRHRDRLKAEKYGPEFVGVDLRGRNPKAKGPSHPRWSEDRMISDDGYVKTRVGRDHPLADPNGYAYEHLVVWVSAGNPRPPEGFHLHHKNEHRTDNRYGNLELLTMNEHAAEHGRLKLDERAALDIRQRYAAGEATQAELGAEYGVSPQRISKVIKGKIWKKAGGPISDADNRRRDPVSGRIISKKAAGRLLDGVLHDDFPEARP